MRLNIELPPNWIQQQNSNGPVTFCREGSSNSFQISWAESKGGKSPKANAETCREMAADFGKENKCGELIGSTMGSCRFGVFGSGTFRSPNFAYIQIWFVSDGDNFIIATHICDAPNPDESIEAQKIAENLSLRPEDQKKAKWKFW